jgi:cytochrome P450
MCGRPIRFCSDAMNSPARVTGYQHAHAALCDRRLVQSMYGECDVLMERVLLTLHGEPHTYRRAIEWKLFRRDFVRYYEREVYPVTLAQTLGSYLDQGHLDLPEFGFRVNINLSADIAGIDRPEGSKAETDALVAFTRKFSEGATLFHSTRDKEIVRGEVADALAQFNARFLTPSKRRRKAILEQISRGNLPEEQAPRDILTVLLANRDDQDLNDDMILREVAFFMQAGAHSSANALTHTFHELDRWCEAHPEDRIRLKTDDSFLQRCVHESLRLHPASPVAWREASESFLLPDGTSIAAGDSVLIDLMSANLETSLFGQDAASFNPHREVVSRIPPFGLTFGIGIHTCFGRDIAGGLGNAKDPDQAPHLGTLTNLLKSLLQHDARPDPARPPVADTSTERPNWGSYPLLIGAPHSANTMGVTR